MRAGDYSSSLEDTINSQHPHTHCEHAQMFDTVILNTYLVVHPTERACYESLFKQKISDGLTLSLTAILSQYKRKKHVWEWREIEVTVTCRQKCSQLNHCSCLHAQVLCAYVCLCVSKSWSLFGLLKQRYLCKTKRFLLHVV